MLDQQKAKEAYEEYIRKATQDDRILGVIIVGGRAKGIFTDHSDYDVILVTTDEGFGAVKKEYPKTEYIDSLPHAISEFREHAKYGTRTQYDRYTFTHNTVLVDKTGEMQKLVDEKGALESDEAHKIAHDALGGYLNSLYRSLKNFRDGNMLASQLDASKTIPRILTFLFAIEGRVRPYNKFLVWELEHHPLTKLPVSASDLTDQIQTILQTGDVETQKEILTMMRKLAIENGHQDEVDDWEGYYFG